MGSDDTGAQRGTAREREGAFGNAVITAEVRYFLVTIHYPSESGKYFGLPKECYCNVSGFVADTPSWG